MSELVLIFDLGWQDSYLKRNLASCSCSAKGGSHAVILNNIRHARQQQEEVRLERKLGGDV